MKKNIFKNYGFPILLVLLAALLGIIFKDLTPSDLTPSDLTPTFLITIAKYKVSVWLLILVLGGYLFFKRLITNLRVKEIPKSKSDKIIKMENILKSFPRYKDMRYKSHGEIFRFKFDIIIENEIFAVYNLEPYCMNNHPYPLKMIYNNGFYKCCQCHKNLDYTDCENFKHRLISELENLYDNYDKYSKKEVNDNNY